jgi:hypothetical protein
MRRLLAAAFTLAAALAAAADADEWRPVAITLEPTRSHESCMHLEAGDKRRYQWKSDAPVDFNIHYHTDKDVVYAVKSSGMRADGGTFVAKTTAGYCWMWTARDKPAKLEGRVEVSGSK